MFFLTCSLPVFSGHASSVDNDSLETGKVALAWNSEPAVKRVCFVRLGSYHWSSMLYGMIQGRKGRADKYIRK